ncbi:hypothetical protein BpHYR1_020913 [Brachionus plicatilis]|uniref:Uncharacterized protein n=1 Tax=Brachionus plicatilis TaxID=10195 RepID=A0A3M7RE71_BRAPC|nr:hypothetical protein BpHYR1_020913 [Brachionus plicatilis]
MGDIILLIIFLNYRKKFKFLGYGYGAGSRVKIKDLLDKKILMKYPINSLFLFNLVPDFFLFYNFSVVIVDSAGKF